MKGTEVAKVAPHPSLKRQQEFEAIMSGVPRDDTEDLENRMIDYIIDTHNSVKSRLRVLQRFDAIMGEEPKAYSERDLKEFMGDYDNFLEGNDLYEPKDNRPRLYVVGKERPSAPEEDDESPEGLELCSSCEGEGCEHCEGGMLRPRLKEGGWESTATQSTTIHPATVKSALEQVSLFVSDFNSYLYRKGIAPVRMGSPIGSSAYYNVDKPEETYGDIDLLMIAPSQGNKTASQVGSFYSDRINDFIKSTHPKNVLDEGKPIKNHVIFKLGNDEFVQVDMIWALEQEAEWARYRATPEKGVKGLVYGGVLSVFGNVIEMSIQNAGVQVKIKDGEPVSFKKQKVDETLTISRDPERFGLDILEFMFHRIYPDRPISEMRIAPLLSANPGFMKDNIKVKSLIDMIKGLAKSFALNKMYGKFNLIDLHNPEELIAEFWHGLEEKIEKAKVHPKFQKAQTPQAKETVKKTIKRIDSAMEKVRDLLSS